MKKALLVFTILMLMGASVFTCCLSSISQAVESERLTGCLHHDEDAQAAQHETEGGCDCPQIVGLTKEVMMLDVFDHAITFQSFILYPLIDQQKTDRLTTLMDAGPPTSDLPLYIKHSILRV